MVLLESKNISMGTSAPDFSLIGVDGRMYGLSDFADAKVLVVVFMCNHCPYVQAIWDRLVDLQAEFIGKGVRFVGINPNFNPAYPEENLGKMKEYSKKHKMNFPYLLDESQQVAKAYGAQCTPDIFVYDEKRKLKYHGSLDDNWQNPDKVTRRALRDALDKMVVGEIPGQDQNPSMGCSIKWRD